MKSFNRLPGAGIPRIQLNMRVGRAKTVKKGIPELKSGGAQHSVIRQGYGDRTHMSLAPWVTRLLIIDLGTAESRQQHQPIPDVAASRPYDRTRCT
jgi:hypothetical protein